MKQKEITINGHQYAVAFNMQTIIYFEELTEGQSFFEESFKTIKNQMKLIMSALLTANENVDVKVEDLIGDKSSDAYMQIASSFVVVSELMGEFFKVPSTEKAENTPEAAEGEKQKN